jgi:hypothetical protein
VLRLTVSMTLVLGLGALAGGVAVVAPPAALAGPDQPVDPVADWKTRWEKAVKDAGNEYRKLADKYESNLEATSAYIRRFVLRYLPDDQETRKNLGYIMAKQGDGTERWERVDTIRDKINELTDLDDPKTTRYSKDKAEVEKKVMNLFKGLARKAQENAAAKEATAEQKAEWKKLAAQAWDRVVEADELNTKESEEAHKALEHPKFEGKYCTPFKYQFIKARTDRQKFGQKEAAATIKPVDAVECDGAFASAGMVGGGAKSAHFVVNTTHGKEVAMRLAQTCEKAVNDLIEVYGFPPELRDRMQEKFNVIKHDEAEFKKILEKGFGMKPAEVQRLIDHHFGGTGVSGEYVSQSSGGADADDLCANFIASQLGARTAQAAARSDISSSGRDEPEDWLRFSMGYDVSTRLLGTKLTTWGTFGRYGEAVEPRPGEDKWVELARRLVQTDDDVPLTRLWRLQLEKQELKPQAQVKGWAFLNFLFERDAKKAQQFVWHALAAGTPEAVSTIYPNDPDAPDAEKSMDKIDTEYREWIIKGW